MKTDIKKVLTGVVGATLASAGLWSCASENPFDTEGTGTVKLHTVVNMITTRAEGDDTADDPEKKLRDNCVVYISNEKGLIYKKKGLDNVDESLTLKTGSYVAEAWSGDSVTASYDKMFFRAYQPFTVSKGNNTVVLNCKIQNVVASINTASIDPGVLKDDYKIIIKNSRGQLEFNKDNAETARGYFMMPNGDTTLEYDITGTTGDGEAFHKTGVVKSGVERAHHYILNFKYGGNEYFGDENGAVFFEITIADETLTESTEVQVPTPPSITGEGFDIKKQLNFASDENIPESGVMLKVCAFGDGIEELTINSVSASELGIESGTLNVYKLDTSIEEQCKNAGLSWTAPTYKSKTDVTTAYLSLSKEMLKRLSAKEEEHVITIGAKDKKNGYSTKVDLRIARSEAAIKVEDPIVIDPVNQDSNPMSITGSTATVTYSLAEGVEGTPGVEYRKEGDEEWKFVAATGAAKNTPGFIKKAPSQKQSITLTGLEPGTTYEYRACCGDFRGNIMRLSTEEKFIIPYANMETWNAFTIAGTDNCTLPGTGADEFWGNGNPGSMTLGVSLTQKSSDMMTSGQSSAKLRSQLVAVAGLGKFAAGNLFAGTYVETQGTDGHLKFGRPYNGSHPKALKVMTNYRPGVVEKTAKEAPEIVKGGLDQGQIYWALTTEPVEIFTKKSTRKLFDKEDPTVLAYGEYTFKESYGPDNQLQELVIPIDYKSSANTEKPKYLVIVCSASKFGDYFCGGEGSTMYLDDFELIY